MPLKHCRYNQNEQSPGRSCKKSVPFCKIFIDSSLDYYLIILFQRQNSQADNKKIKAKNRNKKEAAAALAL